MTKIKELMKRILAVSEVTKVQTNEGNWDFDPYMHGMANGLMLAEHILSGEDDIVFLDAPEVWGKDRPSTGLTMQEEADKERL